MWICCPQVNFKAGQECFFLEFGESSRLAYVKPLYYKEGEEVVHHHKVDTLMLEAFTFPTLRLPPTPGQVLSVPFPSSTYLKFIRSANDGGL